MITTPAVVVQTGASLGGTWATRSWRFERCEDMLGSLGQAVLWMPYGSIITDGLTEDLIAPPTAVDGLLVRLLVEDPTGTITIGADLYTVFWYGKVQAVELAPTGAGQGVARIGAIELGALLKDCGLVTGAIRLGSGSGGWAVRRLLAWNAIRGGDRSGSAYTVAGASIYVQDLTQVSGTGNLWTARQIIDQQIALNWVGPPTLTVNDPDLCLAYTPGETQPTATLWDLVDALANTSRGLVWWVGCSGSALTIEIRSCTDTAIDVDGGVLPANTLTATVQADANTITTGITTVTDQITDDLTVQGERPTVVLTLSLASSSTTALVPDGTSSLQAGWSSAAGSAWTTWDANPQSPMPPSTADGAWAWFDLALTWTGAQAPSTAGAASAVGILNSPAIATNASHGEGGFTGVLTYDSAAVVPSPRSLELVPNPLGQGFTDDRIGPRQDPVVLIGTGTGATWWDMSNTWRVQCSGSRVAIDDGQGGRELRALLLQGWRLFVTVAITGWEPLQASWVRPLSARPLSAARRRRVTTSHRQTVLLAGTVTGIDTATGIGTPVRTSALSYPQQDLPALLRLLAYLRGWYEAPEVIVQWKQRAALERSATVRPGALLTTYHDGATSHAVGALITRRTRQVMTIDDAQGFETSYQTDTITPDPTVLR
jgi:hypothetical protein